jgi:hypothetical protein
MFVYPFTHAYTKLANGALVKDEQPQKKPNDYFRWWKLSCTTNLIILLIVIPISILAARNDLQLGLGKFMRVASNVPVIL